MKINKIIYTCATALAIAAGVTSCSKSSFDINANPNQPTDSTIAYNVLLPAALNNTARVTVNSWGWLQNWLGYWARSGTYAPNTTEETYDVTTSFPAVASVWSNLYDNNYDYQTMQIQATKVGADFYTGIARMMKSHNFQILVDLYNNVPYSQALKGGSVTTPVYDKGIDVYKDLFRQIDTAMALIQNANEAASGPNKNILTDDIMFGTSRYTGTTMAAAKQRWSKFGNTLKLKMLIHLTGGGVIAPNTTVSGIDLNSEFAKLTAASFSLTINGSATTVTNYGFLGAGENAAVNPGYSNANDAKQSPFYNSYVKNSAGTTTANSQYFKANSFAIEYYDWNGDPRKSRFYDAGSDGFKGVAYGLPSSTDNSADRLAGIGVGVYRSNSADSWILTGAESLFLQAEARHRGFLSGGANTMLQSAITESFVLVGSTATAAASYITGNATYPDVDYAGVSQGTGLPAGGLFTIISQKWFALNAIDPLEVYCDYRRVNMKTKTGADIDHFIYGQGGGFAPSAGSGYPANTVGPPISVASSNTATSIPTRLLYPQSEYNYNPANVGAQGTISKYGKVFWDN